MNDRELDQLVEAAAGAFRARDPSGVVRFHPAWYDLDAEGRAHCARAALGMRRIEALLDHDGLSTTARAVLGRIRKPAR